MLGQLRMRGMIFVALIDWAEAQVGEITVDRVLSQAPSESGGAYTNVGQYDFHELLAIVARLAQETGQPVADLCRNFGRHLLGVLIEKHSSLMLPEDNLCNFLQNLDRHIHAEVLRLHPNSRPPSVLAAERSPGEIRVEYRSHRPMADLAEGLLLGCIDHFGEPAELIRNATDEDSPESATFTIRLLTAAVATA